MCTTKSRGGTMITARIGSSHFQYESNLESYFQKFRQHIIGIDQDYYTSFGKQKIIYADWTASGRLYEPIELKMKDIFGPFMANTHTESNVTSSFMTLAYQHAKKIIKEHVHADQHDVILMDGFGMTSVINKLQRILGLRVPEMHKQGLSIPEDDRPLIFITHREHHSNHISWLETIGEVVVLTPDCSGDVDIELLEKLLRKYHNRRFKIGSFSACSNVTGLKNPIHQLARIMHQHGGLCFVDFAASAPYAVINMHPNDPLEKLDAIFFSPHKFLGGPGTSGVCIFDSRIYVNNVPDHPGGGTVTWTNPWGGHSYIKSIEEREDGGTPGILQGIRTGLCIKLKEQMGTENMLQREEEVLTILLDGLAKMPEIHVFEQEKKDRLGIVSYSVRGIHYNLVVKLLNDVFGFQVRGGCSCAGIYGHYLFGLNQQSSKVITDKIDQQDQSLKPGWVRFSIHPTMTNEEIYQFLRAMRFIIQNSEQWKKQYVYDKESNDYFYKHQERSDYNRFFRLE